MKRINILTKFLSPFMFNFEKYGIQATEIAYKRTCRTWNFSSEDLHEKKDFLFIYSHILLTINLKKIFYFSEIRKFYC